MTAWDVGSLIIEVQLSDKEMATALFLLKKERLDVILN